MRQKRGAERVLQMRELRTARAAHLEEVERQRKELGKLLKELDRKLEEIRKSREDEEILAEERDRQNAEHLRFLAHIYRPKKEPGPPPEQVTGFFGRMVAALFH